MGSSVMANVGNEGGTVRAIPSTLTRQLPRAFPIEKTPQDLERQIEKLGDAKFSTALCGANLSAKMRCRVVGE
jgi:hypothetical protein